MPSPDPTLGLIYVCYCTGARTSVPVAGPQPDMRLSDQQVARMIEWAEAVQRGENWMQHRERDILAGFRELQQRRAADVPVIIPCPVCDQPMQVEQA